MSSEIEFTADADEAILMVKNAADALEPPGITEAVKAGAEVIRRGIYNRAPLKSGRLARSFNIEPVSATSFDVASTLIYAPVHEFGATIRPRQAKYLRFRIGDRIVFAKKVTIPPRPYVQPTYDEDGQLALDTIADHIDGAF